MIWQVPHIWQGGDVWIIGGGPSIIKQFDIPDSLVRQVINKTLSPSVYSPYLQKLHSKHVIGINVAYMIGNWIDIVFFGDVPFFLEHRDRLLKFPGLKISCHNCVANHNWVKYVPRNKRMEGISTDSSFVCWNYNSGAASISIAANLGAKRIFLLGFDMKLDESHHQHWHDVYNRLGSNKPNTPPFVTHLRGFPQIAKDAKARGIEIYNCNPDSAITVFPKCNVKDIL